MDDVGGDAFIAPHEQVYFPRADEGIGPYGIVPASLPNSRLTWGAPPGIMFLSTKNGA